ncbi:MULTISPECIES: hypothetical protein [Micromonospora]|uniref:Uncharacterized protein n=1 Tax=Micromonospora solifontis TaxID=2487138 RepID=A0ABX9WDA9_9ACTN|nr:MULTISPECIES: hypothetical protein [Micromonospora]NES13857.1 hypothetical protein [Micromonospora sp. PPF5-17B]NES37926.1 hypothetical protein [Micromonospora solifontis]NES53957.1 hypothetical protein [Micromonospora sp. PPF5-6]RNL97775.1 hypothetical protein EFE23_17475 [Micromonospora solifontis]
MPPEHALIDLDDQNHQPAGAGANTSDRLLARRKLALRLVAAFAAGVVLGGFGINQLRDSREQRERNAVVALVALPQSANLGGSSSQGSVQLSGLLMVVNAGPAPVTVRGVTAERPGVVIRSIEHSRLVPPGGTGQVMVELRFECSIAFKPESLSLRLTVETEDEQIREVTYPVALFGSDWQRDALGMCDPDA